jgi:hypothetical protein
MALQPHARPRLLPGEAGLPGADTHCRLSGEIRPDYAWLITPHYNAGRGEGAFTVDIYRRSNDNASARRFPRLASTMLAHKRLRRLRLRLLARFGDLRPGWEHRSSAYPVHGHDLADVEALLRETGFDVSIETVSGTGTVDEHHAAHFVCRRIKDEASAAKPHLDMQAGSAA